ncbi:DUF5597 domain-containing protein [Paenibacillus sp. WQ 127069]|uniref:DUF5597 domain-containing protein n=2 Tax=Paenibacillus baimaensis TaxID=2982185 RepID=A0ABT2UWH0_9BACL|nr:DUF5597 domain-containing protein [Paenibacillus sp. WQ 127069]
MHVRLGAAGTPSCSDYFPFPVTATNVFYAIGEHNALCFAPFGIEDLLAPALDDGGGAESILLMAALNIDRSGFTLNGTGPYLALSYELLGNMLGIIQKYRGTGKMRGFVQHHDLGCVLAFSKYDLKISYKQPQEGKPISGGLVIEVSDDEFIMVGIGFKVEFLPKGGEPCKVGYIRIEEGTFIQDEWIRGRILNGDEGAYRIEIGSVAAALCVEMYKYESFVSIS